MTLAVTLTPSRNDALTGVSVVTGGVANLDFTQVNGGTCATGSAYSSTCTVMVNFSPKFANNRYGAVVLSDATGVVATAYVSGVGNGPQVAYNFLSNLSSTNHASANQIPATLTGLPQAIAIDDLGNLYVGDDGSVSGPTTNPARILKLTYSAGSYIQSTIISGLSSISGLSLDGAGNLYYTAGSTFYKATPVGGGYVSSVVGTGYGSAFADGLGDIYLALGGGIGTAAGLYEQQLQPNGTYLALGPFPMSNVTINQATCSLERLDGFAFSRGILYVEGYDTCFSSYSGLSTASTIYGYTNGTTQSPTLLYSTVIPTVTYTYLPYPNLMAGTPYGSLYFWSYVGINGAPSKLGDDISDIDYFVNPSSIAANAGGDVAFSDAGYEPSGTLHVNTTHAGIYVEHRSTATTETFPSTGQGTVSYATSGYMIGNFGNQPMTLSSVSFPPDFPEQVPNSGDCTANEVLYVTTLVEYSAPNAVCAVTAEFAPTASLGTATSNVLSEHATLGSSSLATPVLIPYTATEVVATASPMFSPAAGTYSGNQTITITDATAGATIYYSTNGNISTSPTSYGGPFVISSTTTVQAYAASSVSGNSAVVSATYTLVPDFTFSASPNALTIASGGTGTATLLVSPLTGFSSAVSFSCTGLPAGATCSFSPASVTPSGTGASSSTLTLSIPTSLGALRGSGEMTSVTCAALLFGFGMLLFRRRLRPTLVVVAMGAVLMSVSGCSSASPNSSGSKANPVNTTITVVATSGTLQHSASIALYVP